MEESQYQSSSSSRSRPLTKSSFTYRSDHSHDTPSTPKHERKESASDKRKTHYDPTTKANPNAAMNEAQPVAAALEKPTLQSLRSFQHHDSAGNMIADPDLSNPTRSRWERPLDTIRSFEAAIDSEYKRRTQAMLVNQSDVISGYASRRSSYYGGGYNQNRYSRASYYGYSQQKRDSYDDSHGMGGPVGGHPQRLYMGPRMQSDPGWGRSNGNNVYPMNAYQQSRDTVNTNGSNGSHSDGMYANEPSSDNSSFERGAPVRPSLPNTHEQHEYINNYGRGPIMDGYARGLTRSSYMQQNQYGFAEDAPPAPPKHAQAPIRLNDASSTSPPQSQPKVLAKAGSDEKRKSWFKRRFSRQ